jgi:hypothetical protein
MVFITLNALHVDTKTIQQLRQGHSSFTSQHLGVKYSEAMQESPLAPEFSFKF